jgi:hypothetical protein
MLMDDDEALCPTCVEQRSGHAGAAARITASAGASSLGATALLDRPTTASAPTTLRYRTPGQHRRTVRLVVVIAAVLVGAAVLAVMAARGDGPLADAAVAAGLVAPPVVDVPDRWVIASSDTGGFRAAVPEGARAYTPVPGRPVATTGVTEGFEVDLGSGGSASVTSSPLGVPPGADDALLLAESVTRLSQGLSTSTPGSIETIRREVPVGNGRAADLVVVDEAGATTTRARVWVVGGRVLTIVTAGDDEGGAELDEVHARLLAGLELHD